MLDRILWIPIQIIIIPIDINRTTGRRWRGRIIPLCSTLLRVHLDTVSSFEPPHMGKTLINWNKFR